MRLLILSSLALVAVRCPEQEIPPIPPPKGIEVTGAVEVTNLPEVQDVRVVEAPEPVPPAQWQVVGFTEELYDGNLGGLVGATRKCQREFPSTRMCSAGTLAFTTKLPDEIPEFAWGSLSEEDCNPFRLAGEQPLTAWSSASEYVSGGVMLPTGAAGGRSCDELLPLACCGYVGSRPAR